MLRYEPSGSETLYYHRNQQYSIIALTDGTGAIEERYAYSAYGEPIFTNASGTVLTNSAVDNRYTYTGREWDEELSLYHFRARMYDADAGRFVRRDPTGFFDGANTYSRYSPISSQDPLGLQISIPTSPINKYDECIETRNAVIGQWPHMCKDFKLEINCIRSKHKPKNKLIGAGQTNCSGSTITIDIYYDDNTPAPPTPPFMWLPPQPSIEQIMFHEVQHARYICASKCTNRCNVIYKNFWESNSDFCDVALCMEVRALILEGGCATLPTAPARKTCIANLLSVLYGGVCPAASQVSAMNECYFDFTGGVPVIPPFPY